MKTHILVMAMIFAAGTILAVAQNKESEAVKKAVLQFTSSMEKSDGLILVVPIENAILI